MGTKFTEVNTLSFIGNIGPKTEQVWKSTKKSTSSAAKTSSTGPAS